MNAGKKKAHTACRACGTERLVEVATLLSGRGQFCRSCSSRKRTSRQRLCDLCGSLFEPGASRAKRCERCELASARSRGYLADRLERRDGRPGLYAACSVCGQERFVPLHAIRRGESRWCPACADRSVERNCRGCGKAFRARSASVRQCDACTLAEAQTAGYLADRVLRRRGVTGVHAACERCGHKRFVALHQTRLGAAHYCSRCRE